MVYWRSIRRRNNKRARKKRVRDYYRKIELSSRGINLIIFQHCKTSEKLQFSKARVNVSIYIHQHSLTKRKQLQLYQIQITCNLCMHDACRYTVSLEHPSCSVLNTPSKYFNSERHYILLRKAKTVKYLLWPSLSRTYSKQLKSALDCKKTTSINWTTMLYQ